jgi:hypothetical protein
MLAGSYLEIQKRNRTFRRQGFIWKGSIEMNFEKVECERVDKVYVGQGNSQWAALNAVLKSVPCRQVLRASSLDPAPCIPVDTDRRFRGADHSRHQYVEY